MDRGGKGADEWPSGRRDDGSKKGGKKGSKGSKLDWCAEKDRGAAGNKGKGKGKGKGKCETRDCYDCGEQGHRSELPIQVDQQHRRRKGPRIVVGKCKPEGEKAEELASLQAPGDEREWCWPRRNRITRWRKANGPKTSISLPC